MEIRAFRGWRFVGETGGDISRYIAPPYDILSAADKEALLGNSPDNVVAVDLPHVPAKELGPDEAYLAAAKRLAEWKTRGVIAQNGAPAVYVYEQTYVWAGRSYVRRAMICGVRATAPGEDVIPHEHVFAGPLADRLRLTECTRTQLSPIFGFYDEPAGRVAALLAEAAKAPPVASGKLRGVAERLWTVPDRDAIETIAAALRPVPVFIADGHHRYTTALNYAKRLAGAGSLPADHEANYVMFALVARDDPGLLVLPTHRIVSHLRPEASGAKLAASMPEFAWRKAGSGEVGPGEIEALLAGAGPTAMALVGGEPRELWVAELKDLQPMRRAAPDESDEWRSLPPAILHRLIFDRGLAPLAAGEMRIEYTADIGEALDACRTGRGQMSVILKGVGLEAVEAIARLGASMPHKSTYFYPKLATGMVFKPLE